jgi:hypothetical protein
MKRLLLVVAVVLLAGIAVAAVYVVRGRGSANPGRIAFWQEGQGDALNLFVMPSDATGRPRALVKPTAGERCDDPVEDRPTRMVKPCQGDTLGLPMSNAGHGGRQA